MPHLGKPYPYPVHRDVMLWRSDPSHRMAKSYKLGYRVQIGGGGSCENITRIQASEPVVYIYADPVCYWRWRQPCPSAYYFDLELIWKPKLEDFKWRWKFYGPMGLLNWTLELGNNGQDNSPAIPNNLDWVNPGGFTLRQLISVNPSPTPW